MFKFTFMSVAMASVAVSALALSPSTEPTQDWQELDLQTPFAKAILVNDPDTTEFTAELVIPYGEAYMSGPEGVAHYIEHLVAKNAFPEGDGQKFQHDYNASTTERYVNYYMNSVDEDRVLSYLSGVFKPITLDDKYMRDERDIVEREYQFREGERPEFTAWQKNSEKMYAPSPLTRSVIGTPESIQSIEPDAAIELFDKFYMVEGSYLVIRSNMEASEVEKLVDEAFKDAPRGKDVPEILITQPSPKVERVSEQVENVNNDVGYLTLLSSMPKDLKERTADQIATIFLSSTQPLALNRKLAFEDKTQRYFTCTSINSTFINELETTCSADPKGDNEIPAMYDEIKEWRAGLSVDDPKLASSIQAIIDKAVKAVNDATPEDSYWNIMEVAYNSALDSLVSPQEQIEAYESITPQDVLDAIDRVLSAPLQYQYDQLEIK